ncbi:hypothetical protein ABTE09_19755, partial [Acinetobacter baumannii]
EVLLIRRIRELLYEQGFTINGARNRLDEGRHHAEPPPLPEEAAPLPPACTGIAPLTPVLNVDVPALRTELIEVQHVLAQLKQIAAKD